METQSKHQSKLTALSSESADLNRLDLHNDTKLALNQPTTHTSDTPPQAAAAAAAKLKQRRLGCGVRCQTQLT